MVSVAIPPRVGRTLVSVAFDVDFEFDVDLEFDLEFDFDFNREGHGLKPCRKEAT
jgi:hypothetical protein